MGLAGERGAAVVALAVAAPGSGDARTVEVQVDPSADLPLLPEALLPVLNVVPVRRQFFPDGSGGRISLPVAVVGIAACGRQATTLCAFAGPERAAALGLRGLQALGLEVNAAGDGLVPTVPG